MTLKIPWDSIDTITFDVFDTSILRCLPEPRHAFLLVEAALAVSDGTRFQGFAAVRFEAELQTVVTAWRSDRSVSPDLEDIYRSLVRLRPDWIDDYQRLMRLECETELNVARGNPAILALYREALSREKAVAFISDTYFSQEHMDKLLKLCGYDGSHRVFSSCVEGNNKVVGGLFEIVAEALGIDPKRTLHIGDDHYSDVTQARNFGFQARLITRGSVLWHHTRRTIQGKAVAPTAADVSDVLLQGLQQNDALIRHLETERYTERRAEYGHVGYSVFGPALAGFTQWLGDKAKNQKTNLYFVSRDGWLLKEAFDRYANAVSLNVNTHYLYASRRNLMIATFRGKAEQVRALSDEFFGADFGGQLFKYCEFLGIAPPTEDDIQRYDLRVAMTEAISRFPRAKQAMLRKRVEGFFRSRVDELKKRAAIERDAYVQYLCQIGITDGRDVGLVDCGWFGSTQSRIKDVLDMIQPDTQLRGYFLGTARGANEKQPSGSSMTGYLIHEYYGIDRSRDFIEFAKLFELFLKTNQSPFYFMKAGPTGEIFPVFGAKCHIDEDLMYLQSEALRFLDDWLAVRPSEHARLRNTVLRSNVLSLLESPTEAQAKALGWASYSQDIHSDETRSHFAAPSMSTLEMLLKPRVRREDLARSGSRRIYEMLAPSALARVAIRLTPVDEMPITPVHGLARRVKRVLKRRLGRAQP